MIIAVKDPEIYPVEFSIERRELSIIDNQTATVSFVASSNRIINRAFYWHDDTFILDVDYTSDTVSPYVGTGKKLVLEFISDSTSIFSSSFNVKAWTNETTFFTYRNQESFDLRQVPWSFADTEVSIYASNSLKQFDSIEVSGAPYYPSVSVEADFTPEYYQSQSISSSTVQPGASVDKTVISSGNHGVLVVLFTLDVDWYYDSARTLPVASPPSQLDIFSVVTFAMRLFFVSPGKFFYKGSVSADGTAIFDGVLTQDYVVSNSLNYGSFSFIGLDNTTDELFVGKEDEVIVDNNGYRVEEGNLSQVYFV